jgi:hypothetical protein
MHPGGQYHAGAAQAMTIDCLAELASLARLADALATATAEDCPPGVHAMTVALAIRLDTLAAGIRLAARPDHEAATEETEAAPA